MTTGPSRSTTTATTVTARGTPAGLRRHRCPRSPWSHSDRPGEPDRLAVQVAVPDDVLGGGGVLRRGPEPLGERNRRAQPLDDVGPESLGHQRRVEDPGGDCADPYPGAGQVTGRGDRHAHDPR